MGLFGNMARKLGRFGQSASVNVAPIFQTVKAALQSVFGRAASKMPKPPKQPPVQSGFRPPPQPPPDVPDLDDESVFLFFEEPFTDFYSSNVVSFQYFSSAKQLFIGYKGRRSASEVGYYKYFDVSPEEARDAFQAISKGGWVWDVLRVRGTQCGHKKQYAFMPNRSVWHPKKGCP